MQTNWMVERATLDSPLYANIFGVAGGDDDVFVWPYMWANREQGLTAAQADEFSNGATHSRDQQGAWRLPWRRCLTSGLRYPITPTPARRPLCT